MHVEHAALHERGEVLARGGVGKVVALLVLVDAHRSARHKNGSPEYLALAVVEGMVVGEVGQ